VDDAHGFTRACPFALWDPDGPEDPEGVEGVAAFAAPWMASRTEGSMRERNGRG
jgi:hypothetical protein